GGQLMRTIGMVSKNGRSSLEIDRREKLGQPRLRHRSKVSEGFRRLAIAFGALGCIAGILFGMAIANYHRLAATINLKFDLDGLPIVPEAVPDDRLLSVSLGAILGFLLPYGL